ncbi:ABC transporter ATP-binding protein [Pseudorhizobium tarimense]|nr:ATP-binding cassette domain-containing protein [Pseudorhizobium tarimense]MCJ8517495.1 ATP-binding cassette domain-containing protein [Pseudorhizobium tarimense]
MPDGFLSLSGVGFSANGRTILSGIDMDIQAGRVCGLVGPNGSGKSTLLKIIARQVAPTSGDVFWSGRSLADWSGRAFARQVAYMPQFTPGADGMTVRELVALGRFPWHGTLGRFGKVDRRAVEAAIQRSDLASFADRRVDNMSGGERQRAWIAMMLAQDARCLILDEPTSALDLAHQAGVLALVRTLAEEQGLTVIVVLHEINLAARYCDTIIALNGGRVLMSGSPREVMRSDTLKQIFGVDMGVFEHPQHQHPVCYLL